MKENFSEFKENAGSGPYYETRGSHKDEWCSWRMGNSFMALQEANGCRKVKVKDEEMLDLMVLIKRTNEILESLNVNTFKFSFCTPIIPLKPCSPFLMSFKEIYLLSN